MHNTYTKGAKKPRDIPIVFKITTQDKKKALDNYYPFEIQLNFYIYVNT